MLPAHDCSDLKVDESVAIISGWPTDTVKVAHCSLCNHEVPNTLLLFVPGNPGCCRWYIKFLEKVIRRLGPRYVAYGTSYAGHGVGERIIGKEKCDDDDRNNQIAWTVDGQVAHKIEWIDTLLQNHDECEVPPRIIFISHSIGAHLVQRLCVLRDDILKRTDLLLHLMPFIRFDPHTPSKKTVLSTVARSPDAAVRFLSAASRVASRIPRHMLDKCLKHLAAIDDDEGRALALELVRQPRMAKNFLTLGLEELREVPERHDDAALRIIGRHCPTAMLFCGGPDQWAPHFHIEDLDILRAEGKLPRNIRTEYFDDLVHDFIVHVHMVEPVADFVCRNIISNGDNDDHLQNSQPDLYRNDVPRSRL